MNASYFKIQVRPRPDLAEATPLRFSIRGNEKASRVRIFPYLAEQSSNGTMATADEAANGVVSKLKALFPDLRVELVSRDMAANQASCFRSFLLESWDYLADQNVLVTHGNFLRNELLRPAGFLLEGSMPNAGVLDVLVTRGAESKRLLMLRHCLSHHNVCAISASRWTTCASVDALRDLTLRIAAEYGTDVERVLYGSSLLPRAVMSALALQRDVGDDELLAAAEAFEVTRAMPQEIRTYLEKHATCRGEGYCAGGTGEFYLDARWHVQT